jgi:hypothetical protein
MGRSEVFFPLGYVPLPRSSLTATASLVQIEEELLESVEQKYRTYDHREKPALPSRDWRAEPVPCVSNVELLDGEPGEDRRAAGNDTEDCFRLIHWMDDYHRVPNLKSSDSSVSGRATTSLR